MKKLFIAFILLSSCTHIEHRYDGYWMIDVVKYGKMEMNKLPIRQWKIEGELLSTTEGFEEAMKKIDFPKWPGETLSINFIKEDSLILSGVKGSIGFRTEYKDFGGTGLDALILNTIYDNRKLTITIMRDRSNSNN